MKFIKILIFAVVFSGLFFSCGVIENWNVNNQDTYHIENLSSLIPQGLVFLEPQGKNWWKGTYLGKPVLIHAVDTYDHVNIEFQYVME